MYEELTTQARQAVTELLEAAKLKPGKIFVVGCSSSEMVGARIGKGSSMEAAQAALDGRPVPELPPLAERVETALRQFHLAAQDKGEHIACLEARKHFAWYLRGVAHSGYYKEKISSISSMDEIESIARGIQRDLR